MSLLALIPAASGTLAAACAQGANADAGALFGSVFASAEEEFSEQPSPQEPLPEAPAATPDSSVIYARPSLDLPAPEVVAEVVAEAVTEVETEAALDAEVVVEAEPEEDEPVAEVDGTAAAELPAGADADAGGDGIAVRPEQQVIAASPRPASEHGEASQQVASPAASVPRVEGTSATQVAPSANVTPAVPSANTMPAVPTQVRPETVLRAADGPRVEAPRTDPLPSSPSPAGQPAAVQPMAATVSDVAAPAPSAPAGRTVAAQVAPAVMSIVQRPSGTHQLTMTVSPESLGPVTVRAHISAAGDVRVELFGATDAGRDALRVIVADLRRDLAAVLPHASLNLSSGSAQDQGTLDRGAQSGGRGDFADGQSGRQEPESRSATGSASGRHSAASAASHHSPTESGAGLDIFA